MPISSAVAMLHAKHHLELCEQDVNFALDKLQEVQTAGLVSLLEALKQAGHQILIIGGSLLGCAVIPRFVAPYGVAATNVYSGYFKGFEKKL